MLTVKQLIRASKNPTYVKNAVGHIVYANEAYYARYGIESGILATNKESFYDYTFERDIGLINRGASDTVEERYQFPDGKEVWYITSLITQQDDEGNCYLFATSTDITDLKTKYLKLEKRIAFDLTSMNSGLEQRSIPDANQNISLLYSFSGLGELAQDLNFKQKMMKLFIETVPAQLNQMKQAVDVRDWATVLKLAHRLKSVYGNIHIEVATEAMRNIETLLQLQFDENQILTQWEIANNTSLQVIEQFQSN